MQQLSLLIPTHNRHHYLNRILTYHAFSPFRIFVADSTGTPFAFTGNHPHCTYLHLPGKSFTQKLSVALRSIETPLVVMCADDDFTLTRGIQTCAGFLLENPSFSAVMGHSICYRKDSIPSGKIQFAAMYTDRITYQVSQDDPFARLEEFFRFYRCIFYAVHRTDILRDSFTHAEGVVKNLFLNEYLTVILPLVKGKVAELPVLFQVREYACNSDDKTIPNLDSALDEELFQAEYNCFLDNQSSVMADAAGKDKAVCKQLLNDVLMKYAVYLKALKNGTKKEAAKQIGSVVQMLPFVGKKIIEGYRSAKEKEKLQPFIKSEADNSDLDAIRNTILRFQHDTI